MYSTDFEYYRASSVADAQRLLKEHPGAKLLAGGHSLIPLMKLRLATPPVLIDIGRIADLTGIAVSGKSVRIGALTTHAELAGSAALRAACPMLSEAAAQVGDPAVRNRGTIGGNIAHADPASDLPPVLVAIGARFVIVGAKGERTVDASDFFQGLMTTTLGEHEILTAIEVPTKEAGQGAAYVKFEHPASRYAVIGAAAVVTMSAAHCTRASIALGGLVPVPCRATTVEKALANQPVSSAAIASAAERVVDDLGDDLIGDIYASAEYRRAMAPVYVKRALIAAARRAS